MISHIEPRIVNNNKTSNASGKVDDPKKSTLSAPASADLNIFHARRKYN